MVALVPEEFYLGGRNIERWADESHLIFQAAASYRSVGERRDQIGLCHDDRCERELINGERDAARDSAFL